MRLVTCVTALAVLFPLTGCDGPTPIQLITDPVSALEVELVPATDTTLPGYPLPVATVIRNRASVPIAFSGGGCTVGFDVLLPNGDVLEEELACRSDLHTWTVGPHDSLVLEWSWYAWQRTSFVHDIPDTGLSPGTYRLRPYVDAQEGRREGRAVPISVLPWTLARYVHTAPLPPLDFVAGWWPPATNIASGDFSRARVVRAGPQTVEIRDHADGRLIGSSTVVFREGVTNTVTVRAGPSGFEPWDATDTTDAAGPNEGQFRVIHLAADAPPLSVFLTGPTPPASSPAGSSPFPYGLASPYFASDPGVWSVVVTLANAADTLLATARMPVPDGQRRTLILIGDGTGGVFGVLLDP